MNTGFYLSLCSSLLVPASTWAAELHGVRSKAPAFDLQRVLQAPEGSIVTWQSLRGKVVVLEFWATWCPSCLKAIPHLNQLADQLEGKPVVFLSVTDEPQEKVVPFLARQPIRGWVGLNTNGSMFNSYGVDGRPLTVVVRADGIVDARIRPWASPFPLTADKLLNLAAGKPSGLLSSRILYAGDVRDVNGNRLAGVSVRATNRLSDDSWRLIGEAVTDDNGHFAVDRETPATYVDAYPIRLDFKHPNFLYGRLEDLRMFSVDEQANLRVTLRRGNSLSGRVIDQAGRPVAGALARAAFGRQDDYQKDVHTDADGRFEMHGLPAAPADVRVLAIDPRSQMLSGHVTVDLGLPSGPATIRLTPLFRPGTVIHDLFGIKMVEMDHEIQGKLFSDQCYGMLVVDPGPHSYRLGIAKLQRGDCIWAIGDREPITDFNPFAQRLLKFLEDSDRQGAIHFRGGITSWVNGYAFWGEFDDLALTKEDLAELRSKAKAD